MNGTVRCNRCGRTMPEVGVCPSCNRHTCYIQIYHQGKLHKYYQDEKSRTLTYPAAIDILLQMNRAMRERKFRAEEWTTPKYTERRLDAMLRKYLDMHGDLSPSSLHTFRSYIENHISPLLGGRDVREVTYGDLEEFKDALPARLSGKYRQSIVRFLYTVFRWMHRKGAITVIPPFPVVKNDGSAHKKALSVYDQSEAIGRIPEEHRAVFLFEAETGIRPAEACAMKIKDLDLEHGLVTVQRTFSDRKLRETTKGRSKKTIPLSESALRIAQEQARGRFPEDYLFLHPRTRKHYTVLRLGIIWRQYSGTGVTHYEATRHSYATQIAESCEDIHAVKTLLRHTDIRSTMNYVHARMDRLREITNNRATTHDLPVRHRK